MSNRAWWLRVFLCVVVSLFSWTATAHADSPQLDALATQLTGKAVTVQCYQDGDIPLGVALSPAGWVQLDTPVIHLQGSDCGALQNVLTPGPRTSHWLRHSGGYLVGGALQTLGHEATHLALDSGNEALVECTAYRNAWTFTNYLGLSRTARSSVYQGAVWRHMSIHDPRYRSVC